jgi:predicted acylesterase/phospholipase RssA
MVERNREAVVAIQGGGVYALSLLGQAKAILDKEYIPLAFAGTSGGAILACLLWCGLSPDQIEAEFIQMMERDAQSLLNLLSPLTGNDVASLTTIASRSCSKRLRIFLRACRKLSIRDCGGSIAGLRACT